MRLGYYQEAVENLENLVNTKEMDDEVRVLALNIIS